MFPPQLPLQLLYLIDAPQSLEAWLASSRLTMALDHPDRPAHAVSSLNTTCRDTTKLHPPVRTPIDSSGSFASIPGGLEREANWSEQLYRHRNAPPPLRSRRPAGCNRIFSRRGGEHFIGHRVAIPPGHARRQVDLFPFRMKRRPLQLVEALEIVMDETLHAPEAIAVLGPVVHRQNEGTASVSTVSPAGMRFG